MLNVRTKNNNATIKLIFQIHIRNNTAQVHGIFFFMTCLNHIKLCLDCTSIPFTWFANDATWEVTSRSDAWIKLKSVKLVAFCSNRTVRCYTCFRRKNHHLLKLDSDEGMSVSVCCRVV